MFIISKSRIKTIVSAFAASLFTLSCASVKLDERVNGACTVNFDLPRKLENCVGSVDVRYQYRNGIASAGGEPVHKRHSTLLKHYVPQSGKNTCFAAALESAFSHQGYRKTQQDFVDALGKRCFASESRPATYSQILFAATRATSAKDFGVWYVDTPDVKFSEYLNNVINNYVQYEYQNGNQSVTNRYDRPSILKTSYCQSGDGMFTNRIQSSSFWMSPERIPGLINPFKMSNPMAQMQQLHRMQSASPMLVEEPRPDLYRPITWKKVGSKAKGSGGIWPIRDTGELVYHFRRAVPVLIGLSEGHVVIATQLWYHPAPEMPTFIDTKHNTRPGPSTRIVKLAVMNPATPDSPEQIHNGEGFFENVSFMFALYGG